MKPRVVFGVERQRLAWPGRVQGPFVCSVQDGIMQLHAMIMVHGQWRVAILICVY